MIKLDVKIKVSKEDNKTKYFKVYFVESLNLLNKSLNQLTSDFYV